MMGSDGLLLLLYAGIVREHCDNFGSEFRLAGNEGSEMLLLKMSSSYT